MNARPHVMSIALVVVCMAAVAWAADAPRSAPAPSSHVAHVAPVANGDGAPVAAEVGDGDDPDFDPGAMDIEGGPDGGGAGGERHVIVRRFMRGGGGDEGGEPCGPMCGGRGMRGGRGRGMEAGRGGDMGPGMFAHMARALDLSEAQRQKLADIHERQMRHDIQARADLEIARLDLRKAVRAEKPEAGAIDAQIDRVAKLRTDMAKAHVASLLEARALLTPDQQKKMDDLRMRPPGAGMPGTGRGFGMGPGGMGENRTGHGSRPIHVRVERDTLIRR